MIKILLAFLISFILSVVLMPIIIKLLKKIHASQTILGYVENHKSKDGTTTMGGVVFIITTLCLAFFFLDYNITWLMVLLVSIFFGVIGFMDDFLKVKYKQNLGLRPYQKIIGQLGLAIIFSLFVYFYAETRGQIFWLFSSSRFNIGAFVIPLIIFVLIACTNSVNLTDGLDGLAGSVSFVYLIFFTIITLLVGGQLYYAGVTNPIISDIYSMAVLSMLFAGSILGFLMFNTNKASIFMGDVGSLCIGGFIGASSCVLGFEFLLPILGLCFVISSLSVIIQVAVYKLKKKRVFKMAPFHHHLQMSALSEPKIVAIYSALTMSIGVICIILYLL